MGLVCAPEQQSEWHGWTVARCPTSPTFRIHTAVGLESQEWHFSQMFEGTRAGWSVLPMLPKLVVQSGWIYVSFPDLPGNGLSGDRGN